jgi:hypothetical protein
MAPPRQAANDERQELRAAANAINFEIKQLTKAVLEFRDRADSIKQRLFDEARAVRRQSKAGQRGRPPSRDAITVLHGPKGRSTRKGHGQVG